MNTIYKTILSAVALTCVTPALIAQTNAKDSTINRQVNVEREYTPTLQDATKINTLPALYEPTRKQYEIRFEQTTPSVQIGTTPITDTGSGDINTAIGYSQYRGYAVLGAGTNLNFEGALGYRIVDNTNSKFDLFGTHNSTNGNIKYLEDNADPDKVKAKNMENFIKALYSHKFSSANWYIGASFLNNSFNYYGYPYSYMSIRHEGIEKNQSVGIFGIETAVKSYDNDEWRYTAGLKYHNYKMNKGDYYGYPKTDGASANIIDFGADVNKDIFDDKRVGLEARILHQAIGGKKTDASNLSDENFSAMTVTRLKPYFFIDADNIALKLGASANYAFDFHDRVAISPYVNFDWNFADNATFYAKVDGGINDNNFVETHRKYRYINPNTRIMPSRTLYDVQVGIKSGAIRNFEFDIFGGYKQTKDDHLISSMLEVDDFLKISPQTRDIIVPDINVIQPIYADLKTGHFGGSLKTKLIPYTDLTFKAVGYFYTVDKYHEDYIINEKKAWGLPSFTVGANADFSFIDNLTLGFSYELQAGRKALRNYREVVKMDNINELNFKASYSFMDWLSVYARLNNALNQKYERFYGYTLQGINLLGGVSIKF